MQATNPIALTLVVIGAGMGFGRDVLTTLYGWLFQKLRGTEPGPRLLAMVRLYFVFTGLIFTLAGMLGLVGILHW